MKQFTRFFRRRSTCLALVLGLASLPTLLRSEPLLGPILLAAPPQQRPMPSPRVRRAPENIAATITGHGDRVTAVRFLPDGRLATASLDQTARIWDLSEKTPRELAVLSTAGDGLVSLAVSPDGRTLATGGSRHDKSIRIWDLTEEQPRQRAVLRDFTPWWIKALAFSPNGQTLASAASADATVQLWKLTDEVKQARAIGEEHSGITALSYSDDGRLLACGIGSGHRRPVDGMIEIWNLEGETPRRVAMLQGHQFDVTSLDFAQDGTRLVSAGVDQTVRLWTYSDGKATEAAVFQGHRAPVQAVAFSPDGQRVYSVDDNGHIIEWAAADGQKMRHWSLDASLASLDVSSDGQRLVVGGAVDQRRGVAFVIELGENQP